MVHLPTNSSQTLCDKSELPLLGGFVFVIALDQGSSISQRWYAHNFATVHYSVPEDYGDVPAVFLTQPPLFFSCIGEN